MPPGGFAYYRNFMASATRKLRVCQLRNVQIFAFVPAELQRVRAQAPFTPPPAAPVCIGTLR